MPYKKGHKGYWLGKKRSEEHKKKMSVAHKGKLKSERHRKNISKGRIEMKKERGYINSLETRKKISESCKGRIPWNPKGSKRPEMVGEKNPAWKGGIKTKNQKIRNSFEYTQWREKVFARDNWTCQECGQRGGNLEADHIKPFCFYPRLRFEISNGRTLCGKCHYKIGWNNFKNNNPIIKLCLKK